VESCAFCRPDPHRQPLWESEHYRVLADEYPRCAGHVLLVTREHLPSQMHAAAAWMPEFQEAQERVRRFLVETFGHAAFYENGGAKQEVPHAHLHGLPLDPAVPDEWLEAGDLRRIAGWEEARKECERAGFYFYLETAAGTFLVRRKSYKPVLRGIRGQLIGQTEAALDPGTGKMARGGPEMVARTAELWHQWDRAVPAQVIGERSGTGTVVSPVP
jgi:diadenosine tetraphosphate (Ap4A) HIT family hydrolase